MTEKTPRVIFLRTPPEDGEDPYSAEFSKAGYRADSLPVLETVSINVEELRGTLRTGLESLGIGGVIMSSSRAVNTWREAASRLDFGRSADWRKIPFYVVGESTAANLRKLADDIPGQYCPVDIRGAAESGTSERLAKFILEDIKRAPMEPQSLKLLYLTGTRNRDTLSNILEEGGVELLSLAVYDTQPSSGMEASLQSLLKGDTEGIPHWWIIFFAPSSSDFALPVFQKSFHFRRLNEDITPQSTLPARMAAIGPTTGDHLKSQAFIVEAVARRPSAASLLESVLLVDRAGVSA